MRASCGLALTLVLLVVSGIHAQFEDSLIYDPFSDLEWVTPDFCGDKDCPPYDVVSVEDAYELRAYKASSWALTCVGPKWGPIPASYEAVENLESYFAGANSANLTLNATVPFLEIIKFGYYDPLPATLQEARPLEHRRHGVQDMESVENNNNKHHKKPHPRPPPPCKLFGMYIPSDQQAYPPLPDKETGVFLAHVNATTVAVRSFTGYATPWKTKMELHHLWKALDDVKKYIHVKPFGYYVATYSPPQQFLGRHTEVALAVDLLPQDTDAVSSS